MEVYIGPVYRLLGPELGMEIIYLDPTGARLYSQVCAPLTVAQGSFLVGQLDASRGLKHLIYRPNMTARIALRFI